MTDVLLTEQECADCFEALCTSAFKRRPFDMVCTILRVAGMQDAQWDPFEESEQSFQDFNWHLSAQSDELSKNAQWRIGLLMYCQACEMSAVHHMLANLLRIHLDQPYHLNPLGSLGRADKKRMFKWYPPSAKVKWKKLRDMAEEVGNADLVRLIDSVYDDVVRNAFSHSDYIISENAFRWTEGGMPGGMPLQNLDNLITNAFSFFGIFMGMRNRWLEVIASMPRYHRWSNFEVFEILKTDGKVDGFRVHFSNGTSARFHRRLDGVDLVNVVIQPDGTISFMMGMLSDLRRQYVVDGQEVSFGPNNSVEAF